MVVQRPKYDLKKLRKIKSDKVKFITPKPNDILKHHLLLKSTTYDKHIVINHPEYNGVEGYKLIEKALIKPYYIVRYKENSEYYPDVYLLKPKKAVIQGEREKSHFVYTRIPMELAVYEDEIVYDVKTAISDRGPSFTSEEDIIYDRSDCE